MATLDGYAITVETESPSYEVDITTQPVEQGMDVTDHVQAKARKIDLSGRVVGRDAAKIQAYLVDAMEKGKFVDYQGRMSFWGLISSLNCPRDYKIADGFTFSMSLTEVRIASSSYVAALPAALKAQAAPVVSAGFKQTKSKEGAGTQPATAEAFKQAGNWSPAKGAS